MKIKAKPMIDENFSEYGQLIRQPERVREAGDSHAYVGNLVHLKANEITVGYLTAYAHDPFYETLEQHKDTAEMLVILSGQGAIPFAKPGDDANDGLTALHVKQGDTILMKPAVWHGLITPVDCESVDLLVVFKVGTEENDLHFEDLENTLEIVL